MPTLPKCSICGRRHSGICRRVIGACFIYGQHSHQALECPNKTRNTTLAGDNSNNGANWDGQDDVNLNGGPNNGNGNGEGNNPRPSQANQ